MYQTTLAEPFSFSGIGLHSGKVMHVSVSPANADTGIALKRADVVNCPYVKISPFNVSSTQLATTIQCGDFPISTIEHLISALYGMGIDNALVDVIGAEIPILDGSAEPIAKLICEAGATVQDVKRKYLNIKELVAIEQDDKSVEAVPADRLEITFEIDFPHEAIKYQKLDINLNPQSYMDVIASARTFGFKKDVEMLVNMGLAKGGSMDNAIVLDDDTIANPEGLRSKNEFVSHKILDLIGDFALIGYRIIGHVHAIKSGHHVNNIFARKLILSEDSYEITELLTEEHAYGNISKIFV